MLLRGSSISVLVPKTRGAGYMRCPLGHSKHPILSDLSWDLGVDMCGLDGDLQIEGTHIYHGADDDEVIADYIVPLSEALGFPFRVVDAAEFYALHPVKNKTCT